MSAGFCLTWLRKTPAGDWGVEGGEARISPSSVWFQSCLWQWLHLPRGLSSHLGSGNTTSAFVPPGPGVVALPTAADPWVASLSSGCPFGCSTASCPLLRIPGVGAAFLSGPFGNNGLSVTHMDLYTRSFYCPLQGSKMPLHFSPGRPSLPRAWPAQSSLGFRFLDGPFLYTASTALGPEPEAHGANSLLPPRVLKGHCSL